MSASAGAAVPLSDRAMRDVARARRWARVAGVCGLVPGGLLVVLTVVGQWIFRRQVEVVRLLPGLVLLVFPGGLALVTLLYARNLGSALRGERPLTAAFANLRLLWMLTTFSYAGLLLLAFLARR